MDLFFCQTEGGQKTLEILNPRVFLEPRSPNLDIHPGLLAPYLEKKGLWEELLY